MPALRLVLLVVVASPILAEPEDPAARLRVAWASQYEWKESGVSNATVWFDYSYQWRGPKDQEQGHEGRGQVVVVDGKVVRGHYPGVSEVRRKQIESHVSWVMRRFAHAPFEEAFQEMLFEGPERTEDGLERIAVSPESAPQNKTFYLLNGDRLAGTERIGQKRTTYVTGDLGGGYGVLGEEHTYVVDDRESTTKRRLDTEEGKDYPYPKSYTYIWTSEESTIEIRIGFLLPTVNAEHPVVGDPAARDALAAAWANRYTLPDDIRIEAQFQRKIDKDLAKLHWWDTVKGTLQVWGMDKVSVELDPRLFRNERWTDEIKRLCDEHFRWLFGWLRDRPFEKEFGGCGFEAVEEEPGTVLVYGHPIALGFRVEEGRISGCRRNNRYDDAWWSFRLRKARGGKARIESMKAKLGRKTCTLKIRYQKHKGCDIPVSFQALGGPRWDRDEEGRGVAEYDLKKIKVEIPR